MVITIIIKIIIATTATKGTKNRRRAHISTSKDFAWYWRTWYNERHCLHFSSPSQPSLLLTHMAQEKMRGKEKPIQIFSVCSWKGLGRILLGGFPWVPQYQELQNSLSWDAGTRWFFDTYLQNATLHLVSSLFLAPSFFLFSTLAFCCIFNGIHRHES